jgi:hypothetical protein
VSGLPDTDEPSGGNGGGFLISWKQERYGHTFVASPYPLPWLSDREDCEHTVVNAMDATS